MARQVLAADLGATKLAVALIDEHGRVIAEGKEAVSREGAWEVAGQLAAMAGGLAGAPKRAGIVVPGIYNPGDDTVWAPNLWGHERVAFGRMVKERLGLEVTLDSDRTGYVLGEHWMGAAQGLSDVVFLALGTGIGAGVLSGGRVVRGAGGIAGSVGWWALRPEEDEVYQQVGCWEALAAGPALARHARAETAEEAVSRARTGEPAASAAVALAARYIGMGVANLISVFNPQMVVLGGGLMQAGDLLIESIRRVAGQWAQPVAFGQARIELARTGERAGLYGAARLALEPGRYEGGS